MKKSLAIVLLILKLLAAGVTAEAQQSTKIPRIGYLIGSPLSGSFARVDEFRQGLRELGYVEGEKLFAAKTETFTETVRQQRSVGTMDSRKIGARKWSGRVDLN
jgi:hypothetical protein